jgi:hypothetical protein
MDFIYLNVAKDPSRAQASRLSILRQAGACFRGHHRYLGVRCQHVFPEVVDTNLKVFYGCVISHINAGKCVSYVGGSC